MSKKIEQQPPKIKPGSSKLEVDNKIYTLTYGLRAHWYLETTYNISFSALDATLNNGKDPLVSAAYMLHALLITKQPKMTLDDVFVLGDTIGFEKIFASIVECMSISVNAG